MRIAVGLIAALLFLIFMHFLNADTCEDRTEENELNLSFNAESPASSWIGKKRISPG